MRKVFWCCLAAGAIVCCAFWAAAYVSQHPDSSLGRVAMVAAHATGAAAPQAAHSVNQSSIETDELIPADPVPIDDAPPLPTPGTHVPAEIAGMLTPPAIVIHDEQPISVFPKLNAKTAARVASATVETTTTPSETTGVSESLKPRGPLVMPYCHDEPAPIMPHCVDEEAIPAMPSAPADDMQKVSGAARPQFDALAFWMGFFSAPGQLSCDWNYTAKKTDLPGGEESSEPPAGNSDKQANPIDLFSHSRHLQMPRPAESASDTMEMRPSDWKPYSLDPGPF